MEIRRTAEWSDGASAAERWNHNNHYHSALLRHLPAGIESALDVGCGQGFFARRLAHIAARVDAVDVDPRIVRGAARLQADCGNLRFVVGDFLSLALPSNHYDAVAAIASLHHMDPGQALAEMRRVLRPGGTLVVLGLYRDETWLERMLPLVAVPADQVRTRVLHRHVGGVSMAATLKDPEHTVAQIRGLARDTLPGARIRRHLFWRYSLVWRKPQGGRPSR